MGLIMKSSLSIAAVIFCALSYTQAFAPTRSIIQQQNAKSTPFQQFTHLFMADNDEWTAPKSAMIGGAGVNNAGEPPFEIRGFSLGNLVIGLGVLITVASFAEYLGDSAGEGLNVSGL